MKEEKTITSMMAEKRTIYPPEELAKNAYVKSMAEYKEIYQKSIDDPEAFWAEKAEQLDWFKKWDKVLV
ncbi:MAG: acetyl-coenzyme A synthetase N-terminal domain-containing protein, partial [Dehalococcoidales bacterium]|nr:acetyl-coenzyme A synthetase N-terminal domain-containing protein [Dehalococcoidales bacterium]